ncbi:hypothetical protein, partial [Paenibacillus marchantiophytorum]|uniref:hypothetical protein n=1 Tax=Paenibacillus marchantiophytorum TaxID=1619310 RepID=UPI001E4FD507
RKQEINSHFKVNSGVSLGGERNRRNLPLPSMFGKFKELIDGLLQDLISNKRAEFPKEQQNSGL